MPRRTMADLTREYPGVDVSNFAHPEDVKAPDLTTWGVVVGGIHYAGRCPTRAGEYPYCDQVELPSYSLAKSMFAALGLMRLERLHPGHAGSAGRRPRARVSRQWRLGGRDASRTCSTWRAATASSAAEHADEDPTSHADFLRSSHPRRKIDYACDHSRAATRRGERFVYRTTDTYMLGTALARTRAARRGREGGPGRRPRRAPIVAPGGTQPRGRFVAAHDGRRRASPSRVSGLRCCRTMSPGSGSFSSPG